MDSKRQGEIALKLLKHLMHKEGVTLSSAEDMRIRAEMSAEMTGIPAKELLDFARPLFHEIVDECFSPTSANAEKTDGNDKPNPDVPLGEAFASATKVERSNIPPVDMQD
jgi:hypothetical protein